MLGQFKVPFYHSRCFFSEAIGQALIYPVSLLLMAYNLSMCPGQDFSLESLEKLTLETSANGLGMVGGG